MYVILETPFRRMSSERLNHVLAEQRRVIAALQPRDGDNDNWASQGAEPRTCRTT
jgi:hypothetical protein